MEQYLATVVNVLEFGTYKENRTAVDTISNFSEHYTIDVSEGFPLLTTKKMDGYRWDSLIHELFWYLSGEEHIRNLREHTSIWDEWANDDGELDTAYGRFWRRYPVPNEQAQLPGEHWPEADGDWVSVEETDAGTRKTFDQIQYVIDQLNENPHSRRLVVNAWHPANAANSTLPPCHYTFVFNVQGDKLNLHLTQRSADLALGVPFNIAAYSLILKMIAQQTDFKAGEFSHTLVDAHVYVGKGERGKWYKENIDELQDRMFAVSTLSEYAEVGEWITESAPALQNPDKPYDHVPGLLNQLSRDPLERPTLTIPEKSLEGLNYDDINLEDYESYGGLSFGVAE